MRISLVLLLLLVACDTGEIAYPSSGPVVQLERDASQGEPKSPADTLSAVVSDSGSVDADASLDAGTDSSLPDSSLDSGIDSSDAGPTCESGTTVVGHCLFNMATACQEYFSDHSVDCPDRPMGGTWWAGPCGGEPGTDLSRSSGGCHDECGSIHWSYRLGGYLPNDESRQGWKDSCEAIPGRTYIPVPSK